MHHTACSRQAGGNQRLPAGRVGEGHCCSPTLTRLSPAGYPPWPGQPTRGRRRIRPHSGCSS